MNVKMKKLIPAKKIIGKKTMNVIFYALCIFWIFFLPVNVTQVMAQGTKENGNGHQSLWHEKFYFSGGLGYPEVLNVGVCYQQDQFQFGIYIGSVPWFDRNERAIRSLSGDVRYYFGGVSKLSTRRPWYLKLGIVWQREQWAHNNQLVSEEKSYWLATRVGRDFNLTKKLGIFLELGPAFCLYDKYVSGNFTYDEIDMPILPGFGTGLFYRF